MKPYDQCLVFLEIGRGSTFAVGSEDSQLDGQGDSSGTSKFVLFPSQFDKDHRVCEIFRQAGIQVIDHQISLPKNTQYECFKIILDVDRKPFNFAVQSDVHFLLAKQMFGKSCSVVLQEDINYEPAKILSVIDEENYRIIEKFIASGADIQFILGTSGGTFLHFAVKAGHVALIKLLLDHGANPNAKMVDCSTTALFLSIEKNDVEIVRLLLQHNANPNLAVKCVTPLEAAMKNERFEIVKLLIENGADVSVPILVGGVNRSWHHDLICLNIMTTPLHLSIEKGSIDMVKLFVESGADLNVRNYSGATALHVAAEKGQLEIVECLLLHGASLELRSNSSKNFTGATPLITAILNRCVQISALLVEKGANVNAECHNGDNALFIATLTGQLEILEILLKGGPDLNNLRNQEAFKFCLSKDLLYYQQLTLLFLQYGFDIQVEDANNPGVLLGAVAQNLHHIIKKLFQFGASANQFTVLQAYDGILERYADLTFTILHQAARLADEDMIQLLLNQGAEINAAMDDIPGKRTPLFEAIRYSNLKTAKALLDNKAEMKHPAALLQLAIANESSEAVQLLLLYGLNVNGYNSEARTPLCFAVGIGNEEVFALLIKFGAHGCFTGLHPQDLGVQGLSDSFHLFLDFCFTDLDLLREINSNKRFQRFWNSSGRQACEQLACHIIKTEAAYESVGPTIPTEFFDQFKLDEFKNNCKKEVERMKLELIPHTEISFYNILTKKTSVISLYARDENTVQALKESSATEKFPIYASIVKSQIRKGTWRRHVLNVAIRLSKALFSKFSELPDNIKEKIVDYLNNQEILILEKWCNIEG